MKKWIILFMSVTLGLLFCTCKTGEKHAAALTLDEDSVRLVLQGLSTGFKNKDINLLQNYFSEHFSISVLMWPSARRFLDPVLANNPIENIDFVATDTSFNDMVTVKVKVKIKTAGDKPETESVISFDKDYKVVFIDYLDRLYGVSRYSVSEQKAVIPFEFDGKYIIIPLRLNDCNTVFRFLLDTGADGMAIGKTLSDSLNLSITGSQYAGVVGGQMRIDISSGNTVHLTDTFSLKNQKIAVFENMGNGHDGIIGLNLAMNYITKIDFDRKQITLSTFGDYKYEGTGETVKIKNRYNVITVAGVLNIAGKEDVNGEFIFDSGADYYLIAFSGFVRKNRLLLTGFKPENQSATVSMGHSTPVFEGKAHRFALSPDLVFTDIPVTLQASTSKDDDEKTPSGSIGIELIQN
ncbi:MAG: retropepsin-like domain-containing protein, partial [Prevotellaceae bacterium]|nr:retropepsin-like domain-containing protein [Prevotellaceae bacterium]